MRSVAILAAAVAVVSCGGSGRSPTAPTVADSLSVLVIPTLLGIGETGQATARLRTETSSSVVTAETWRTTDPAIASVSTDGEVSARARGTVTITGTYGGLSGSVTLRILSGDEVALTFHCGVGCAVMGTGGQIWRMTPGQLLTLLPRATFDRTQISVTVYDVQPATRVIWTTSDPSVVSVSAGGEVTAHAPGTASLTATWLGQSATVPFIVS